MDNGLIGLRATMGPLQRTTMPLRQGLTALYGLNGAGKSSLLQSIRIAFSGVWGPGWYSRHNKHVALFFKDDEHLTALRGLYQYSGLRHRTLGRHGPWNSEERVQLFDSTDLVEWLADEVIATWGDYIYGPDRFRDFAKEVVQQNVIAFVPSGATEPSWEVWLCTHPSEDAVHLRAVVDAFALERERLRRLDESASEAGDDEGTRWIDLSEAAYVAALPLLLGHPDRGNDAADFVRFTLNKDEPLDELLHFDGWPVPVAKLGTVTDIPWKVARPFTVKRAARLTRDRAVDILYPNEWVSHDSVEDLGILESWAENLSYAANGLFARMLLEAPKLTLIIGGPQYWFEGEPMDWYAQTDRRMVAQLSHLESVKLDQLSRAERKWAAFSIINETLSPRPHVWLLDEPEAALHRSAEEHMARGLASVVGPGEYWVAATHSPPLLDDPRTHVLRVHRESGITRVSDLNRSDWSRLDDLGLLPSDLLRRWRVILLVEGHHEEIILDGLLRDQLHGARVKILPVGGVGQLAATIDSRLLWDFTDASVIAVVDNEKAAKLESVWEQAWNLDALQGTGPAVDFISKSLTKEQGFETKVMRDFLSLAIAKGHPTYSRILPFAFSKPDITDYLPISALLPEEPEATWEALRLEQQRQTEAGRPVGAFKPWLEKRYGKKHGRTIFTDQAIRSATRQMELPDEFQLLMSRCLAAGSAPADD